MNEKIKIEKIFYVQLCCGGGDPEKRGSDVCYWDAKVFKQNGKWWINHKCKESKGKSEINRKIAGQLYNAYLKNEISSIDYLNLKYGK